MENSRKLGKARKRDRLSRLPGPIIYHILSFLATKAAVQTSVLSRAWRCAWKHVPLLHLDSDSFKDEYSSFVKFVGKVLALRYPINLHKVSFMDFKLTYDEAEERKISLFDRVIGYACSHDAQQFVMDLQHELDVEGSCEFSFLFRSATHNKVETLELICVNLDFKAHYSYFRSLTTLNLRFCWLERHDVLSDTNFPCLKNLVVKMCESRIVKGSISGQNLVSLKLLPVPFKQFEIFAPKLKFLTVHHLRISDSLEPSMVSLPSSLPSLEHAEIAVCGYFAVGDTGEKQMISLFQDLHNAKSLTLHSDTIWELSKFSGFLEQQPSPFTRLEYLNLQSNDVPFKVANYFLKGSSNTEPRIKLLDKYKIREPYYIF